MFFEELYGLSDMETFACTSEENCSITTLLFYINVQLSFMLAQMEP